MRLNRLFNFTLLMTLLGLPVGSVLLSEVAIAQQKSNLDFQNVRFSSAGMQTMINGSATTTITLSIQNYGSNNRSFDYSEKAALSQIILVDSQKNRYRGQFETGLNKPFFNGENRLVKLQVLHPMRIHPSYLQLDSGDPKKPIYIRL